MKKHLVFISFLSLYFNQNNQVGAQSFLTELNYSISFSRGFIMPDAELAPHLSTSNPNMMELRILHQSQGEKDWERWYQKPRYGLNLSYTALYNPKLGNVIGIQWIGDFALRKRKQKYLSLITGIGIGLVTDSYDRRENHKNRLIGSMLNVSAIAHLSYSIPLSEKLSLQTGIGITHYSNGATVLPNAGINYVSANIGLTFQKVEIPAFEPHKSEKPNWNKRRFIDAYIAGGWREQYPTEGPKYPVFNANVTFNQRISKKFTLQSGFDFVHNQLYTEWEHQDTGEPAERISWVVGGEVPMGNFATFFQLGLYLYKPHNFHGLFYNRLGWKYNLFKDTYALFAVKAQGGSVDNLEFGLGYRF